MLSLINLCRILTLINVVFKFSSTYVGNISKNSTNKNWCITKIWQNKKLTSCKFQCWKIPSNILPLENEEWRNSIDSLHVQIIEQNCSYDIDFNSIQPMKNLSNFALSGHLKTFNLTALSIIAPKLKTLFISLSDLNVLFMDNLSTLNLNSIYILGKFDPKKWQFLKSSENTLKSFSLALNKKIFIPEKLFSNMKKIECITLHIVSEKMSSYSFSNLPILTHLTMQNNNYHTLIKFQKNVFYNLPNLKSLKIHNFDIDNNETEEKFCNKLSENIYYFLLEGSSTLFMERCSEVWKCVKCGIKNPTETQIMEFKSLLTSFKTNTTLDDILPNPSSINYLNTSKLLLIDTHIPLISSRNLARFPLLTHYHHHRSWRSHDNNKVFNSIGDVERFTDNPFEKLLNNQSKLTEVKISVATCDCNSYKVYRFLISKNVSVYFYCRDLAEKYELANIDSWISEVFYVNLMNQLCYGRLISINLGLIFSCLWFFFRFYYTTVC